MAKTVRKAAVDMYEERLQADLERYRERALELGATHAKIVKAEDIPVDERVTLKCQIPRCFGYGASAHCPPNTMNPAELRDLLKKYHWAVFFTKEVPPEVIVRDKATIKERVAAYQQVYKIVNEIESMAFYDAHYLAFGFAAGSCRHTFCGQQEKGAGFLCDPARPWRRWASTFTGWRPRPAGTSIPSAVTPNRRICPKAPWPASLSSSKPAGRRFLGRRRGSPDGWGLVHYFPAMGRLFR